MRAEYIIKQATQIASFYESLPNQDQADRDFVSHIRRFWDPRMRRDLIRIMSGPQQLSVRPMVRRAVMSATDEILGQAQADSTGTD